MRRLLLATALILTAGFTSTASLASSSVSAIVATPQARLTYLAHSRIWQDPGALSPEDIRHGPAGVFPAALDQGTSGEVECTFAKPGKDLGGNTAKFLCRTSDGETLRLKYWDPDSRSGNREVFAMVAGTRLLWALGFDALPAVALTVRCIDCPKDPMTGHGPRRIHEYLAEWQAYPPNGPWILSRADHDEGWSWQELDDAIASLPPGEERTRQRTHFDALTLLGVLVQHGDRKPEQQALYCAGSVDLNAGDTDAFGARGLSSILLERQDATACGQPAIMLADVGATFGGAGRTSNPVTAKMNLEEWRHRRVFNESSDGACHGHLRPSFAAGHEGERNPVISEEGRRFLLEQLQRLTPAHLRALFTAAHVGELGDGSHKGASADHVIDEWIDAFQDKVQQIAAHSCEPASWIRHEPLIDKTR